MISCQPIFIVYDTMFGTYTSIYTGAIIIVYMLCLYFTLTGRAAISSNRKFIVIGLGSNSEGRVLRVSGGAIEGRQVDS